MIDASNNPECGGGCLLPILDERYNTTVQEYVEIIRDLTGAETVARVKDIATRRGVKASSVSTAIVNLKQLGLIDHKHYGYVELTDNGRELGQVLARRHAVIRCFLRDILGLEGVAADDEACRLEHTMSGPTLDALIAYVTRIKGCPWCGVANNIKVDGIGVSAS